MRNVSMNELDLLFSADIFKVLSDPVRLELIKILAVYGPNDINTIAGHFNKHRSVISRHLKQMHEIGLVVKNVESRNTYYYLDGIGLLLMMEGITGNIKSLLEDSIQDDFNKLYDKGLSFSDYLKTLSDSEADMLLKKKRNKHHS